MDLVGNLNWATFSLQVYPSVGQPLFMPSRKGTHKLIMMSATSLLPSMPSVMSGYTKQMTPSSQLLVVQNTLVTTSAPRVLAVNAVRTSHRTTSTLKVHLILPVYRAKAEVITQTSSCLIAWRSLEGQVFVHQALSCLEYFPDFCCLYALYLYLPLPL